MQSAANDFNNIKKNSYLKSLHDDLKSLWLYAMVDDTKRMEKIDKTIKYKKKIERLCVLTSPPFLDDRAMSGSRYYGITTVFPAFILILITINFLYFSNSILFLEWNIFSFT